MAARTYDELIVDPAVQAQIGEAKAAFPGKRFRPVDTAAGVLVLMNPSAAQHNMIMQGLAGGEGQGVNLKFAAVMLQTVCANPDKTKLVGLLEEWPGICTSTNVMEAYQILAGQAIGDYQK